VPRLAVSLLVAAGIVALGVGGWVASDNVASGHALWAIPRDYVAASPQPSPLDPLSTKEIETTFRVLEASPKFPKGARFPIVRLQEPPKAAVLAWSPGKPFAREAYAEVYDGPGNHLYAAVVDLKAQKIVSWTPKPGVQPAVSLTEYSDADALMRADPRWRAAMKRRGINPNDVYLDVWAAGDLPIPGAKRGDRILRALSNYEQGIETSSTPQPNPYDRPIEGVVVTADMTEKRVISVVDSGVRPVATAESGSADIPRPALAPLHVDEPLGPEFSIDGTEVSWQGWRFRVGYSPREGLVLYRVGFDQNGRVRPVIYRMAMDEIYVPYSIPDPNWQWRAAFDIGEYNLGQYAEPLQRGVDVPDNAYFFDESTGSDTGTDGGVYPLPHAIAVYEQDAGSLWDRTDPTSFVRDARLARELVVMTTYVIGNYTYSTRYIFRLDGGIDVRVSATGTTLNQGIRTLREGEKYGTPLLPDIAAPVHQHFFNFRIDFDVDGTQNRVVEQNVVPATSAATNGFLVHTTPIATEGARDADPATSRQWVVQSTTHRNIVGHRTGYSIADLQFTRAYSGASFPPLVHAPFAQHAVWVTRYRPGQMYAAGDYPNQGKIGDGLTSYAAGKANVQGKDVVVWVTTSFTHIPDIEEYPVMTSEEVGFSLRPDGFFDRNPALDVP